MGRRGAFAVRASASQIPYTAKLLLASPFPREPFFFLYDCLLSPKFFFKNF